jgi:hypothetical protein
MGISILKYAGLILGLLLVTLVVVSSLNLTKQKYNRMVKEGLKRNNEDEIQLFQEEDMEHLPYPVQQYLQYVGVVGREKVHRYSLDILGEFKMSEDHDFAPVTIKQTSFQKDLTRLFYMNLSMKGLKIAGLHHLVDGKAFMEVKILDVFKVVDESGELMNISEMVTVLNDMAIMAPATLIDPRISWEQVDEYSVLAKFTNNEHTIEAQMFFNDEYQLINFVSEDRYALLNGESRKVRWETPSTEYQEVDGMQLPYKGSAIWVFEDREFEYVRMQLEEIKYNE